MATQTVSPGAGREDVAAQAPNLTPPPGNPRFPLFDSLRAIAALSVFLGHTVTGLYTLTARPHLFLGAVQLAYQGVAIFFLISGFLLYRPFVRARRGGRPVALGAYCRRRVLRIVPAYWAALTLCIVAGFVPGVTGHNWWVFYGFGQVYDRTTLGHGIGVAWTLCIEVTFYAVLPLLALAAAKLSGRRERLRGDVILLVALSGLSLAWRAHYHAFFDVARVSTLPGTFTWFALGMGLALASVRGEDAAAPSALARFVIRRAGALWAAALLVSVGQYELVRTQHTVAAQLLSHVVYGLVALLILLPAAFGERACDPVRRLLRLRVLAWVGLVSYGVYLYHTIVIAQLVKGLRDAGLTAAYPVVLAGSLAVTLLVSAASYYALERPIMRWGSARSRRASAARGGGAAPGN